MKEFIFIDKVLPFRLHSAPKLFSALADVIQWILHCIGIKNSLDDLYRMLLDLGVAEHFINVTGSSWNGMVQSTQKRES